MEKFTFCPVFYSQRNKINLFKLRFSEKIELLFIQSKNCRHNSHAVGMDLWVETAVKSILWETLFLNQLNTLFWVSILTFISISIFEMKLLKEFLDTKIIWFSAFFLKNKTFFGLSFWPGIPGTCIVSTYLQYFYIFLLHAMS